MTRKDYQLIAEVIATAWHGSSETKADLVNRFADALEDTNPRFNREIFFRACGINPVFTERMFTPSGEFIA